MESAARSAVTLDLGTKTCGHRDRIAAPFTVISSGSPGPTPISKEFLWSFQKLLAKKMDPKERGFPQKPFLRYLPFLPRKGSNPAMQTCDSILLRDAYPKGSILFVRANTEFLFTAGRFLTNTTSCGPAQADKHRLERAQKRARLNNPSFMSELWT
jgi:hypothetical protein